MASHNSFNARTRLTAGGETVEIFSLPALERAGFSGVVAAAVLPQDPAREPAAPRGRPVRRSARHPGAGRVGRDVLRRRRRSRSRRRACCCRTSPACRRSSISPRCATASSGSAATRRRSTRCSRSSSSSTTRCRSITIASVNAADLNAALEFARNKERYTFLRWGQEAFQNFRVVPPDTGIVHQVNLEYLARVVFKEQSGGAVLAYPDTLVGTDSHTTMVNGLGVVGWGVGGIEAEAAMLGQPISMLIPEVVGFRLVDRLPEGATATDLVLTITERLRKFGVVGKFVEFYGPGLRVPDDRGSRDARQHVAGVRRDDRDLPDRRDDARLPAADRARRSARAAGRGLREGAGAVPHWTTRRIRSTRRRSSSICRPSSRASPDPKRPQDRVSLRQSKYKFQQALDIMLAERKPKPAVAEAGRDRLRRRRIRRPRPAAVATATRMSCRAWKASITARSSSPRSRAARTPRTRA